MPVENHNLNDAHRVSNSAGGVYVTRKQDPVARTLIGMTMQVCPPRFDCGLMVQIRPFVAPRRV